jgi:outer membrane protein assembly factor BamB
MERSVFSGFGIRSTWVLSALVGALGCSSNPGTTGDAGNEAAAHEGGVDAGPDATKHDASTDGGAAPVGVLQHHGDGTRAGFYVDPAFTKAALPGLEALPGFSAAISGSVFAQPLFLQKGVKGTDAVFVVTEANNVYALDALTGAELWKTNVGTPEPQSALPTLTVGSQVYQCGSIAPLGITGTPIIDLPSRSLLVSAMTMQKGVPDFLVIAISLDDGAVEWSVDLNAEVPEFSSLPQMQRGALALLNGVVYVPFGGQAGGCQPFHGWVIGVPLAAPHKATGWHTGSSGAGIWGPSGAASDTTSVYVATASPDTYGISPVWSDNDIEAILRIGDGATFSGARKDYFVPTEWFDYGIAGTQLGSAGVVLFDQPGSTPSQLAFAIGKTSDAYLVDRTNLGGIGGEVAHMESATTDWVEGAMAAYSTSKGGYVALTSLSGSFCSSVSDLSTIKVIPGNPPKLAGGWCALQGGAGSPIATASSAASGSQAPEDVVAWGLGTNSMGQAGSGKLRAFDGDTGALLAESPTTMPDLEHWISPIVANGRIYIAGDTHVYAFDLAGAKHTVTVADAGAGEGGPPAQCLVTVDPLQVDPCAAFGLTCQGTTADIDQGIPYGTCMPPTEDQSCKPAVGCASGFSCVNRGSSNVCQQTCTTTSDCTNILKTCTPLDGGASSCTLTSCTGYYSTCSGGTGTCLPYYNGDGSTFGVCSAGGDSAGPDCSSTRGTGTLCPVGTTCFATATTGACLALCDYEEATFGVDAGVASCPSGQSCVFLGGQVAFGACAPTCGGDAGTGCTGALTCQEWNAYTGQMACLP